MVTLTGVTLSKALSRLATLASLVHLAARFGSMRRSHARPKPAHGTRMSRWQIGGAVEEEPPREPLAADEADCEEDANPLGIGEIVQPWPGHRWNCRLVGVFVR